MIFPTWLIKPALVIAIVAMVVLMAVGFYHRVETRGYIRGHLDAEQEFMVASNKAILEEHNRESARRVEMEKAREDDARRQAELVASSDAARNELGRLRQRLKDLGRPVAASPGAPAGPVIDGAPALYELFATCADRYVDVAREADFLASQVIGLQNYVRAALLQPIKIGGDSPAGERSRAGTISLATQPATEPLWGIQLGAAPPQGDFQ